jgi:hypothetical protein
MGALTFTFTATEQLQITDLDFPTSGGTKYINVTIRNTGTNPVTINEVWVNNVKFTGSTSPALPLTVGANDVKYLSFQYPWQNGANYEVKLVSSKGNTFLRTEVAPSSA